MAPDCCVRMVWSVRDVDLVNLFAQTLRDIDADDGGSRYGYSLHLTSRPARPDVARTPTTSSLVMPLPTVAPLAADAEGGVGNCGRKSPGSSSESVTSMEEATPNMHHGRPELPGIIGGYMKEAARVAARSQEGDGASDRRFPSTRTACWCLRADPMRWYARRLTRLWPSGRTSTQRRSNCDAPRGVVTSRTRGLPPAVADRSTIHAT